jgi:hypothetical protein
MECHVCYCYLEPHSLVATRRSRALDRHPRPSPFLNHHATLRHCEARGAHQRDGMRRCMLSVAEVHEVLNVAEVPAARGAYQCIRCHQCTRCQLVLPNTLLTSSCRLCRCCAQRLHFCNHIACNMGVIRVSVTGKRARCANTNLGRIPCTTPYTTAYNMPTPSPVHRTQLRQIFVFGTHGLRCPCYASASNQEAPV